MKILDGEQLREARDYLALSQMEAAEQLEVSLVTYQRWEQGKTRPRPYNLRMIQLKFQPALQRLGLGEAEPAGRDEQSATLKADPPSVELSIHPSADEQVTQARGLDISLPLVLQLLSLADEPPTNHDKPMMVRQVLKEFDKMNTTNKSYQITRRDALGALAAFPFATPGLSRPGSTVQPTQYAAVLARCSASLGACWELGKGSEGEDIALAFQCVSQYLPMLETIANNASHYRQEALDLAARYAIVKTDLGWHCSGPLATVQYAKNAVTLSQATGDISLELSALSKLAWAYFFSKQYAPGLAIAQEAEACLQQYQQRRNVNPLHPTIQCGTYSTLALLQARNGQSSDFALGKTTEIDPGNEEYAFMNTKRTTLLLETGWTYCYQGDQIKAMEALEQRVDPQTLVAKIPQSGRGRVEVINAMTLSSLRTTNRDMEQTIHLWTASIQGARALKSEQRFQDAVAIYEHMEVIWPGEKRIAELRELIEHW